jgi:hypothetical protein
MSSTYLDVLEADIVDESIKEFKYCEKDADQSPGNLNVPSELTISFQNEDAWMLPHKSYLIVEGTLKNGADNWTDANGTGIAFINNGLMYMFDGAKYFLGNQQIEYFQNCGIATTMHNLLTKSKSFQGLHNMWYPDEYTGLATCTNIGYAMRRNYLRNAADSFKFSAIIPLSHIFNFANDYKKVIYGMQHKISLQRQTDGRALLKNNNAADAAAYGNFAAGTAVAVANVGSINITKLRWAMPTIIPNTDADLLLKEIIRNKQPVSLSFLNKTYEFTAVPQTTIFTWKLQLASGRQKPRYLVLGFQTARTGNQLTNNATFNPLDVLDAYIVLNTVRYPYAQVDTNLANNMYAKWYYNYLEFRNMYTGEDQGDSCLDLMTFKSISTLYVFDVSHQSERMTSSEAIDINVYMRFAANAAANTIAHMLTYSDSLYTLSGDGRKQLISVV